MFMTTKAIPLTCSERSLSLYCILSFNRTIALLLFGAAWARKQKDV